MGLDIGCLRNNSLFQSGAIAINIGACKWGFDDI